MLRWPDRAGVLPSARLPLLLALSLLPWLGGCDALGLETPGMTAERRAAEARAVGAACRHAVRSIEDCFASNPRMSRAEIFEGWREMDQHMRDYNIEGMPQRPLPAAAVAGAEEVIIPGAAAVGAVVGAAAGAAAGAVAPAAPAARSPAAGTAPATPARPASPPTAATPATPVAAATPARPPVPASPASPASPATPAR